MQSSVHRSVREVCVLYTQGVLSRRRCIKQAVDCIEDVLVFSPAVVFDLIDLIDDWHEFSRDCFVGFMAMLVSREFAEEWTFADAKKLATRLDDALVETVGRESDRQELADALYELYDSCTSFALLMERAVADCFRLTVILREDYSSPDPVSLTIDIRGRPGYCVSPHPSRAQAIRCAWSSARSIYSRDPNRPLPRQLRVDAWGKIVQKKSACTEDSLRDFLYDELKGRMIISIESQEEEKEE